MIRKGLKHYVNKTMYKFRLEERNSSDIMFYTNLVIFGADQ